MKALKYKTFGDPSVLYLDNNSQVPQCKPHQIMIQVKFAGINPFDVKRRKGMMHQEILTPVIPSVEASGIVVEVGEDVRDVTVGDAVFGFAKEGAAEFAILTQWAIKPDNIGFAEAASITVSAQAALRGLDALNLVEGQTILIHGGSGGVGQAAIQFALKRGLKVIADGSPKNHAHMEQLGAIAIQYGPHLIESVHAQATDGVDGILDTSGTQMEDLLKLSSNVVTFANYESGVRIPSNPKDSSAYLEEIRSGLASGYLSVHIVKSFTLEEGEAAHRFVETGHAGGRVVFAIS